MNVELEFTGNVFVKYCGVHQPCAARAQKTAMQQVAGDAFKLAFLKRMLLGFHLSAVSSAAALSPRERSKAVNLAADAAAGWTRPRGLSARDGRIRERTPPRRCNIVVSRSKKILRRYLRSPCTETARRKATTAVLARALVRRRIQVLRKLVPGGESMDALSLLDETLDYAKSLKAQVDAMRWLLKASESSNCKVRAQQSALQTKAGGSV